MSTTKYAKANVPGLRQDTQYTCCAVALTSCLIGLGKDLTQKQVNDVMGAAPNRGASWEEVCATAQYFGARATLMVPCSIPILKSWTDQGIPAIIAWNPEGRPWSHASVVFDVDDDFVYIMDSNIPDPEKTERVIPHSDFYSKWSEKYNEKLLIRRPACAIELEVSPNGKHQDPKAAFTKTARR